MMILIKTIVLFWAAIALVSSNDDVAADRADEIYFPENDGPTNDLGLGRFQYADILLVSRVPSPVNKWDYVLIGANKDGREIKNSGREDISTFTPENYPDVQIIIVCGSGDVNYFYHHDLNVPIVGVDAFYNDRIFTDYLESIYQIHNFWDRSELWAHFLMYPKAFDPVIARIRREYGEYLEQWTPNPKYIETIPYEENQNPDSELIPVE